MNRTFIIAEAGVNHNGSIDLAKKLIEAAADAGADAVKFQTFKTEKLATPNAPKAEYQRKETASEESQFEMLKKLELDIDTHYKLKEYARKKGIMFLSTPFDEESALMLINELKLPMIKISSGDLTNAPLLLEIAKTDIPIILSTGMADLEEIEFALKVVAFGYINKRTPLSSYEINQSFDYHIAKPILREKVTLLHCTTEYPASVSDINLKSIQSMYSRFDIKTGYSDHTIGIHIPVAAVAMGATVIEKHFTLDREMPGPDHKSSLEPDQLKEMVLAIRDIEKALGTGVKKPVPSELKNRLVARKSIVAVDHISKGEIFTSRNIGVKRPGNGLPPLFYWDLIGKVSDSNYEINQPIKQIE